MIFWGLKVFMTSYPPDVLGSVVQFVPLDKINLLLAYSYLPRLFLTYHNLDFIIQKENHKELVGNLTSKHLNIIYKNHNIGNESMSVYFSLAGHTDIVKNKLLSSGYNTPLKILYRCIDCVCLCDHLQLAKVLLDHFSMLMGHWAMCGIYSDESRDNAYYIRNIFKMALKLGKREFIKILLTNFTSFYDEAEKYLWSYYTRRKLKVVINLLNMADLLQIRPGVFDALLTKAISDKLPDLAYKIITHPKITFIGKRYRMVKGFKQSCEYGYVKIVAIYLRDSREFDHEIKVGDFDLSKLPGVRFDLTDGIGQGFKVACASGQIEVLKVLLTNSDLVKALTKMDINYKMRSLYNVIRPEETFLEVERQGQIYLGLEDAIKNGHLSIITYILVDGHLDPRLHNYHLIRLAAKSNQFEIVKAIHLDGRGIPKGTPPKSRLRTMLNKIRTNSVRTR